MRVLEPFKKNPMTNWVRYFSNVYVKKCDLVVRVIATVELN